MLQGFFTKKEVESPSSVKGRTLSCFTCGLARNINSPKLEPYGLFKKSILILADAPSDSEDEFGKRWAMNNFFKSALNEIGVDLYEDCITIGAVNCRPPKGRLPKPHELNCCRGIKVLPIIKQYQPKLILVLGTEAMKSLIGHLWKKDFGSILKWRGWRIPDLTYNAWVCPTYHPNYVHKLHSTVLKVVWKRDLRNAIAQLTIPFPIFGKINIKYITDLSLLNRIKSRMIVFDYETNGKKPHSKLLKIICTSVAVDENSAYVFLMPEKKKGLRPFLNLLSNSKIRKVAQNFKFEDNWTTVKLFRKVKNWFWDTMIAMHIIDNRPLITSLKFQTYIYLGVIDYDSEIAPYLKSKEKGGYAINKIDKLMNTKEGQHQILKYCALDSIYTYRIAILQMKKFGL